MIQNGNESETSETFPEARQAEEDGQGDPLSPARRKNNSDAGSTGMTTQTEKAMVS